MNNSEIELELMNRFGLEKTIMFCEMASIMFSMLYENAILYRDADDCCDYDFDRDWWANKREELRHRERMSTQPV